MEKLPKNEILKQLKQQFINGTLGEYDPKYEKNVAAWEKSRQPGLSRISCASMMTAVTFMCSTA